MAKTKSHNTHHHNLQSKTNTMDATDDASEKLDSLKSLNAMLLKETVERRQQVDSLVNSNSHLESELNRYVTLNDSLQLKMNSMTETAANLDIEKRLLSVFAADIDKQRIFERDEIRAQLNARIREVNELLMKVTELEKDKARVSKQVIELKEKCDRLVKENAVNVRRIDEVASEKELLQMNLVKSKGLVDDLNRKVGELIEHKKVIEDEKNMLDRKNDELRVSLRGLEKVVESMRLDKESLVVKFANLEKKYDASLKNKVEMRTEIDGLVELKKEVDERIKSLENEKSLVTKDLEDVVKELEQHKVKIKQIELEKDEIENDKVQRESEVVKMNEQLNLFKEKVSLLEEYSVNQIEKFKRLEDEILSYKASFDQVTIERDEALSSLKKEKTISLDYKEKITGMEKEIKEMYQELSNMKTENVNSLGEKKELEDRCAGLMKEVASLETKLAETQVEFDDTKGRLGVAEANSNRVLTILKRTLSVFEESSDLDQEKGVEEGIKEYVTEVEAIKRAFKDKESRVEEMKRQLELVKNSVDEVRKEKSFWTMVSSATTLLAAVASLAYVARAH